ncbi:MAG TPA: MBL fold metallo-hydrolase [Candidatus Latescibacteria bacterium]|nr:MBL fold metallo-hydrolase [Candidatus Latescibacterota bacterium]
MPLSQWGRILVDEMEAAAVPPGDLWIWPLGGASLAVKSARSMVYIDPYTGSPSSGVWIRMVAVPFDPRDVRIADAVLSTHDHDDHCHGETLRPFADNTGALFIGPASSASKMRSFKLPETRIMSARHGDSFRFSDITVEAVEIVDHSDPTSVGWLVSVDDGPVLFDGGDGMYDDYFKKVAETRRVSAATLSIAGLTGDGRKIYMDARELVAAAEDLGVDLLIPKHWDLWRNVWLDPWEVVIAAQARRARFRVHIPRLGEVIRLPAR